MGFGSAMEFAGVSDSNSSYLQECKNHLYRY